MRPDVCNKGAHLLLMGLCTQMPTRMPGSVTGRSAAKTPLHSIFANVSPPIGRHTWPGDAPGVMVDDQDLERLPAGCADLGRPWRQITQHDDKASFGLPPGRMRLAAIEERLSMHGADDKGEGAHSSSSMPA